MKTKLYVEPGTDLDWDNENHRRILEEEAYAEYYKHPKPTMARPERSRWWWLWRMFGYLVFLTARRAWAYYSHGSYVKMRGGELGPWRRRFESSEAVKNWLWGRPSTPKWLRPLREFLYWLLIKDYICTHCGFTDYGEEITFYAETEDGEDRTINLFEHVEGGGVDYWGEAEDAHGWMWCYRCGSVEWESV